MEKSAVISDCGKYRYLLTREWDSSKEKCVWIMLNPSVADANIDDPTITRVVSFSKLFGYGGCIVLNLFSLRATDPQELKISPDPIGELTYTYYQDLLESKKVVCAWGEHGKLNNRSSEVKSLFRNANIKLYCLGTNKSGEPKHPLYISNKTKLIEYI